MHNRMILADCRDELPKIPSDSVDLVLTDPPYNTGLRASNTTRLTHFFDDAMPADEYRALAREVCRELFRVLKNDRAAYVFMNWKSLGVWLDALAAASFRLKNTIVWDKVIQGLNYQNYAYTHEFLIFAVKGQFHPRNRGLEDDAWHDVWHIQRELRQAAAAVEHHETVKPEAVLRRPIEHASQPGDLVLDPFAGTGTTCVIAKKLGRRFIGIERESRYHGVAVAQLARTRPDAAAARCGRTWRETPCEAAHRPRPRARRTSRRAWKARR